MSYIRTRYACVLHAVCEAMTDLLENGGPTPHNPAIMRDRDGSYYYGSSLHGDEIIIDLADGFGSDQPETMDEISDSAIWFTSLNSEENYLNRPF